MENNVNPNTNANTNSNYKTRSKLNWNNPEDYEKVNRALNSYTRIYPKHYHLIPHEAPIKYFNHDNGYLRDRIVFIKYVKDEINGDKVVVMSIYNKKYIHYMSPSKLTIFICDMKEKQKMKTQKRNLYKLYKANLLKVVEEDNIVIDDEDSLYVI